MRLLTSLRCSINTDHLPGIVQELDKATRLYLIVVEEILLTQQSAHRREVMFGVFLQLEAGLLGRKPETVPEEQFEHRPVINIITTNIISTLSSSVYPPSFPGETWASGCGWIRRWSD